MLHATKILQETQSHKEILQPNSRNGVLSCPLMFCTLQRSEFGSQYFLGMRLLLYLEPAKQRKAKRALAHTAVITRHLR